MTHFLKDTPQEKKLKLGTICILAFSAKSKWALLHLNMKNCDDWQMSVVVLLSFEYFQRDTEYTYILRCIVEHLAHARGVMV